MRDIPVTHNQAVPAPFLAKNVCNEFLILTNVGAIDLVISCHNGCRLADSRCNVERHEVNLAGSTVSNNRVNGQPLVFLVIAHKVLKARRNTLILDTLGTITSQ